MTSLDDRYVFTYTAHFSMPFQDSWLNRWLSCDSQTEEFVELLVQLDACKDVGISQILQVV